MSKKEKQTVVEKFIARDLARVANPDNYNLRDQGAHTSVAICPNPSTGAPTYDILDGTYQAVRNHRKHGRTILRIKPGMSAEAVRAQIK